MGGHGGLNILPQKRWNVYNRDNRLKVARDEAAHAAEQAVQQEKHRAAEAQARRNVLLERAKQRRAAALGLTADATNSAEEGSDDAADSQDERRSQQQAAASDLVDSKEAAAHRQDSSSMHRAVERQKLAEEQQQQQQLSTEVQEEPVLEHINFWKEYETKAQHPERQAEERAKKKRRGNPDTHTTDERFDESFQLAYGLTGPKPWYARPVNPTAEDTAKQIPRHQQQMLQQQQQENEVHALPGGRSVSGGEQLGDRRSRKRRRRDVSSSSDSSSSDSSSSDSDSSRERSRRRRHRSSSSGRHSRDRSSRRHSSKHKEKQKRRKAVGKVAAHEDTAKALALAKLRAERLEREAAERRRALEATGLLPPAAKRFNNSYGYADALRREQMGVAGMPTVRGVSAAAVAGLSQRFRA